VDCIIDPKGRSEYFFFLSMNIHIKQNQKTDIVFFLYFE